MKKFMILFFVYLMLLCIPFSALAEPLRWLDPWISLAGGSDEARKGTIRFSLSADGLMPIMEASYATTLTDWTFQGMTEEEADDYLAAANALLQSQLHAARINLDAFSALMDTVSMEYILCGDTAQFTVLLNQEAVCTFALIKNDDNETYLISDLAPSYALKMNEKALSNTLSVLDYIYVILPLDYSQFKADEGTLRAFGELIALLPDLADLNILSATIESSRMELEALAENGAAIREGDHIFYTGDRESCMTILDQAQLEYAYPFSEVNRLLNAFTDGQEQGTEEEEDQRFFLGDSTEEDMEEIPFSYTYAIQGSCVTQSQTRTLEYVDFQDTRDPITGVTTRISTPSSWEQIQRFTITPVSVEIHSTFSPSTSETITIDAAEPDQIRLQLTNILEDSTETLIILVNRDEEGQHFSLQLDTQSDYSAPPAMRLRGQWKNDILSDISLVFDTHSGSDWADGFTLSSQSSFTNGNEAILSIEGRSIITPDRHGDFADQGYQKELQQIGKARLNMLVLTKLPSGARPLLSTLLSLISSLGQ